MKTCSCFLPVFTSGHQANPVLWEIRISCNLLFYFPCNLSDILPGLSIGIEVESCNTGYRCNNNRKGTKRNHERSPTAIHAPGVPEKQHMRCHNPVDDPEEQ